MKTQKRIPWSRQDVDNKVLSVRWHLRQNKSLDRRGNNKQVTGGTVSSDPSLESLAQNSKQTNKVTKKPPSHSLLGQGGGTRQLCSTKGLSFKQPLMVDALK